MLKKFSLEDYKPVKTPMSSDTKLTKDEECESVDSTKYRGMIGSLLYVTTSRPDIMFSVCLCSRFQEDPKTSQLEAVKCIFRYIKGTTHLRLWYPKGTDIETIVYADSDHAGDYVDRKSTSGICTSMCSHIGFECLLEINEQIVPHFILEFYSQYRINYDSKGQTFVEFIFQNQLFSFSLEEFDQILRIPYEGDCSFSDKWSFDDLPYSVPTGGPYQTNPLSPDDIKLLFQIKRQGVVTRIRYEQEIVVEDNQILTHEITDVMKTWVDIIQEKSFVLVVTGIMSPRVRVICSFVLLPPHNKILLTSLLNEWNLSPNKIG
ncbi:hypothetical protein Tco_1173225 [Tanacetum coccineum]